MARITLRGRLQSILDLPENTTLVEAIQGRLLEARRLAKFVTPEMMGVMAALRLLVEEKDELGVLYTNAHDIEELHSTFLSNVNSWCEDSKTSQ